MDELTTKEVAQRFGVTLTELNNWLYRGAKPIPVRKEEGKLRWGPDALEVVREYVDVRRSRSVSHTAEALAYMHATQMVGDLGERLRLIGRDFATLHALMVKNPPSVLAFIHSLPHSGYVLLRPIGIVVAPERNQKERRVYRAFLAELRLEAYGKTVDDAIRELRDRLLRLYLALHANPDTDPDRWMAIQQMVIARQEA